MRFLLAGQPNSGKSTIFNAVAGYRSATANFPGTSVTYTKSRSLVLGEEVEIFDLPGIYSLTSAGASGGDALKYLLEEDFDVVINVVDASRLGRSLELTLQLLELEVPVVVALNMVDEARRKGIEVSCESLEQLLGVPVVETIGMRGHGLRRLLSAGLKAGRSSDHGTGLRYDREVEEAVETVSELLDIEGVDRRLPRRFVAVKLLEGDGYLGSRIFRSFPQLRVLVEGVIDELEHVHGWTSDQVVSGNRHAVAHGVEDSVVTMHPPRLGWRERVDRLLLHPLTGGPIMLLVLATLFVVVFDLGRLVEAPLVDLFDGISAALIADLPERSLIATLSRGVLMGFAGGLAIVLPYLVPFLVGLAVLEDTGYVPRMAYILDSFMHRLGLHGKSVLPLAIGYGCSVPAVMAARILETKRDRRITAALTALIPCSARTIVIFGLVAAFMGPLWALAVYLINIVIVVILGNALARRLRGRSPGLILEIPDLRLPVVKTLAAKTWLSLKEFLVIAWPVLVVSSAVLALLEWAGAGNLVNTALSPLTVVLLGLPAAVGMTLIFGVMRKELTLVMLVQALGTTDVSSVLSPAQLMTFSLFVVFYVPCVATMAALAREVGWRDTAAITGLTVVLATLVGVICRAAFVVLG